MMTLIRLELFKISRRLRSYTGFVALAAMTALMVTGLNYGPPPVEHLTAGISRSFTLVGSFVNAGFVAWMLLQATTVTFLPLFASLVPGDVVSGESSDGTLRMLLARSVNRTPALVAKYVAGALYTLALVGFLGIFAYVLGALVFGRGSLLIVERGISIYPESEGIARLAGAYALAAAGMLTVATVAFFLSTVVNNSTGAIIGAVAVTYIFMAVGEIEYFRPIRPYLYTTHLDVWRNALVPEVAWSAMLRSLCYLGGYIAVFFSASLLVFSRKDVLT